MKPEDCIMYQMTRTLQNARKIFKSSVKETGLTPSQAIVLNFLNDTDNVTANNLGMRSAIDSATLTGILDRLEAAGLVERRNNPDDRRTIFIRLTDEGRVKSEIVNTLVSSNNREFLSGITGKDESIFRDVLKKISNIQIPDKEDRNVKTD